MVANGTTMCSAGIGSQKMKKNWREICEYLRNRIDRTRILRKVGCFLEVNMEALEQVKKEKIASQRQQHGVAVGCCRYGSAHPPRGKAVGTALLGEQSKEQTEGALGMIAQWREFWRNR